eukprot:scaffold310_cov335-Pavlova_lutheri.AAC.72
MPNQCFVVEPGKRRHRQQHPWRERSQVPWWATGSLLRGGHHLHRAPTISRSDGIQCMDIGTTPNPNM